MEEEIKKIKEIIEQNVKEQRYNLIKIIFFGSRARGDFNASSDWDILIVLKEQLDRNKKIELSHFIRKNLAEFYIPCDVIIKSKEELEKQSKSVGCVVKNAVEEGHII